jgi:hypothetical protein
MNLAGIRVQSAVMETGLQVAPPVVDVIPAPGVAEDAEDEVPIVIRRGKSNFIRI